MIDQRPCHEPPVETGSNDAAPEVRAAAGVGIRDALAALRQYAKSGHDASLGKARELLAQGRSPEKALEFLAHTLMNRLLHAPSANLRAAALRGDVRLLRQAERLFGTVGPKESG